MVEESTDSSVFQQYMTFIRFVDSIWMIHMKFLDLPPVGIEGATSDYLVKIFKQLLLTTTYSLSSCGNVVLAPCSVLANSWRMKMASWQCELRCSSNHLSRDRLRRSPAKVAWRRITAHLSKLAEIQGLLRNQQNASTEPTILAGCRATKLLLPYLRSLRFAKHGRTLPTSATTLLICLEGPRTCNCWTACFLTCLLFQDCCRRGLAHHPGQPLWISAGRKSCQWLRTHSLKYRREVSAELGVLRLHRDL